MTQDNNDISAIRAVHCRSARGKGKPGRRPAPLAGALICLGSLGGLLAPLPAAAQDATATSATDTATAAAATTTSAALPSLRGALPTDTANLLETADPSRPSPRLNQPANTVDRQNAGFDSSGIRRIVDDSLDAGRINIRTSPIDERRILRRTADDGTGIRLGTMILKPELSQGISSERQRSSGRTDRTTYWDNGLRGSLTSDWSRHELSVTGEGRWRQVIAGDRDNDPSARINAALRLDLADDMALRLTSGYAYGRESNTDPNAIRNATVQSGVSQYSAGAVLEKELGKLRGSIGVNFDRYTYGDARLADGSNLSNSDRNRNTVTLASRVGYQISPALTPFVELSVARSAYDQTRDTAGFSRDGTVYGTRVGVASDLGEKLRGEIAIGYDQAAFNDSRLDDFGAFGIDGKLAWSPLRGTNVDLGLATTIEPTTTAGVSGDVAYALTAVVTHELRRDLVARLSGGTTWRNYPGASQLNTQDYSAGIGLTYSLNRYVDLTADLTYERTTYRTNIPDDSTLTAGIGLKLRR